MEVDSLFSADLIDKSKKMATLDPGPGLSLFLQGIATIRLTISDTNIGQPYGIEYGVDLSISPVTLKPPSA
jgi:hypothetical protein